MDSNIADDFSTTAFTVGETKVGLPKTFQESIQDFQQHTLSKRAESARQFSSGCQDNFAIFAFLAFLLTVLDLILEMNSGRKKRSSNLDVANEASSAAFSLYRGFLNSVSTTDSQCALQFMCEGSMVASKQGHVGKQMAYLTGIKLKSFPKPISTWHEATLSGLNQILKDTEICEELYPDCREIPENYRHPGIMLPKDTDQTEVRLLLDAIDPIYDKWRQNSTLHYFGNFTFV